jgi:transcriptional regulator with XRE-family HTH domain
MQITINSVADLGLIVRAVRRASDVRLDDLAATAGVSKQFAASVEHGKPTVQLGLVLKLLSELGVPFKVDIPRDAEHELSVLRLKGGVRSFKKRARETADHKSESKPSDSKVG